MNHSASLISAIPSDSRLARLIILGTTSRFDLCVGDLEWLASGSYEAQVII